MGSAGLYEQPAEENERGEDEDNGSDDEDQAEQNGAGPTVRRAAVTAIETVHFSFVFLCDLCVRRLLYGPFSKATFCAMTASAAIFASGGAVESWKIRANRSARIWESPALPVHALMSALTSAQLFAERE